MLLEVPNTEAANCRAVVQWTLSAPVSPSSSRQKTWDLPHMKGTYDQHLQGASDCRSHATLLATEESGAWLHALPVSSLGLRMDDHTTRIAVGLRLGTPLCQPHICHHCGGYVDALATHGLSCIKSQDRISSHAAINAIIQRSLAAINVPSTLEPIDLCRSDRKRPDGCSIAPWKSGQCLVWDFNCVDTFAASYKSDATREARAVATAAEARKKIIMLCCPNPTILYQLPLRPQVPLALMLSVCSQISAGISRA